MSIRSRARVSLSLQTTARRVRLLQIEREILRANARQAAELVAERDEFVFRARDQQHVSAACGEFSGKCAPMPDDAPVMRVVFIKKSAYFNSSRSSSMISALLA
jgi:hypothetical protein